MLRLESFSVCGSTGSRNDASPAPGHLLTDFFPTAFPDTLARVSVVSWWESACNDTWRDWQATLVVTSPGRAGVSIPLLLSNTERRYHASREIMGIPLDRAGSLLFEVRLAGETVFTHTVTIHSPGERANASVPVAVHAGRWTDDELNLVGTLPDAEVAQLLGRSLNSVRLRRSRLEREVPEMSDGKQSRRRRRS